MEKQLPMRMCQQGDIFRVRMKEIRHLKRSKGLENAHVFKTLPSWSSISLIVINIIIIGLRADKNVSNHVVMVWIDICICIGFLVDLLMRLLKFGFLYHRKLVDVLDSFLVITLFFDTYEQVIYSRNRSLVIRCLSILRIVRIVDSVIKHTRMGHDLPKFFVLSTIFKDVVRMTIHSFVFWVITGTLGAVMVTSDILPQLTLLQLPGNWEHIRPYFGSIGNSLVSGFQVVTLDHWQTSIVGPMQENGQWFSLITMILVLVAGNFVYINIYLGGMVDKAAQLTLEHDEVMLARIEADDEVLRRTLISNHLGNNQRALSLPMFKTLMYSNKQLSYELYALDISMEDIKTIFRTMDSDGIGTISQEDFSLALGRIRGTAKGRDLVHILSLLGRTTLQTDVVLVRTHTMETSLQDALDNLSRFNEFVLSSINSTKAVAEQRGADALKAGNRKLVVEKNRVLYKSRAYDEVQFCTVKTCNIPL